MLISLLAILSAGLLFGMIVYAMPFYIQYIAPDSISSIPVSVSSFSRCMTIIFEGKDFGVCAMGGTGPLCKFDSECSIPKKGFYLSCIANLPGKDNEECITTAGVGNNKCFLNFQCMQESPNTQGNDSQDPFLTDI